MSVKKKILGIPGSLRSSSSSALLMKHAAALMPEHIEFTVYNELGQLPHFDDSPQRPASVDHFCTLVSEADGVLIITPEYAFGVPGSLKNALDWTVGTGEFVNKPLALVTAASVGKNAHEAFLLIFTALSADIPEEGKLLIPFIRAKLDAEGNFRDEAVYNDFKRTIGSLVSKVSSP